MKEPGYRHLVDVVFPDIKNYLEQVGKSGASYSLYNINDGYFIYRNHSTGDMVEVSFEDVINYLHTGTDLLKVSLITKTIRDYIDVKYYNKQCIIDGNRYNIIQAHELDKFGTKITLVQADITVYNFKILGILDFLALPLKFIEI
jgi:hypothetical protein